MDKLPVGQLPDLTQSNNDDEIMVITNSEYSQLKKEKILDLITDFTSTNENNALTKGTDGKMFVTDFGNASNITEGTLPTSILPEIPLEKLPVSGVSADTYAYPSSVTVNAQGQVTAIEAGEPGANNANQDLSNLSEKGEKHFLNKTQITNCILEIPQDIKFELTDDVLKLKAGSKVYIPNGVNNFDTETISNDITVSLTSSSGTFRVFYRKGGNVAYANQSNVKSGSTPTKAISGMYYDITLNKISYYNNNTTGDGSLYTFPLAEITITNGVCTSINQIFNGLGYIGSTIFLLPNLKVLLSAGRNADGTLNNYELNISKCLTYTTAVTLNNGYFVIGTKSGVTIGFGISPKYETDIPNTTLGTFTYNRVDNYIYANSDIGASDKRAFIASISVSGGVITSFKANYPFRAVDYNDFYELQNSSANTSLTNLTNGLANVICTTAPTTVSTASAQKPAVVIENYVNGTSGYRVYSDGYCEQWGRYGAFDDDALITVSLLKNYNNTNYLMFNTYLGLDTHSSAYPAGGAYETIANRTSSSFVLNTNGGVAPYNTSGIMWKTSGYIK